MVCCLVFPNLLLTYVQLRDVHPAFDPSTPGAPRRVLLLPPVCRAGRPRHLVLQRERVLPGERLDGALAARTLNRVLLLGELLAASLVLTEEFIFLNLNKYRILYIFFD